MPVKHVTNYRFEQRADGSGPHKLYVYDEVRKKGKFNWDEWKYEESETSAKYFRDRLDEIPDGEEIELHVNSAGGEVGEGVAIYNLLRQKSKAGCRIVGYVDGMAYSVAMDIIMAADEIHMGLGTSMFLHNPWALVSGNAKELRSQADQLDALADASRQLYMSRAKNITDDELADMMDKETMLTPDQCKQYGFCDYVGEAVPDDEDGEETEVETEKPDDQNDLVNQLKNELFKQQQINMALQGIQQRRNTMSETMAAALQLAAENRA